MSKFRANIFLIQNTSNYLWASEVGAFCSNSFIFELKVEKKDVSVFSTQFFPLISIFAPKILEDQNCQL